MNRLSSIITKQKRRLSFIILAAIVFLSPISLPSSALANTGQPQSGYHSQTSVASSISANLSNEIISLRTETTKTYQLDNGNRALLASTGIVHYKDNYSDEKEQWKDIDLTPTGNRIDKAPYILTTIDNTYIIVNKKTGDTLTITGEGELESSTIGFRLKRTLNSVLDIAQKDKDFQITQSGNSIRVISRAYDADGVPIPITYSIKDGVLSERIDSRNLDGVKYPVTIDPTVEVQIGASTDDARTYSTSIILDGTTIYLDYSNATQRQAYFRFLNITVPAGATIVTASIDLKAAANDAGTSNLVIYGIKEANTATFSTQADADGRTLTTASTAWAAGAWTANNWYGYTNDTKEIKDIITEIIGVVGWASGNALGIRIDNTPTGIIKSCYTWDYGDNSHGAKLYIEYSAAGGTAPTVSSDNTTLVEETTSTLNATITSGNATSYGARWGIISGNYTSESHLTSSNKTGSYSVNLTGLTPGQTYYISANASNAIGSANGSELSFITKPNPASSFNSTDNTTTTISGGWINGTGTDYVEIRRAHGLIPPTDNTSDTLVQWGDSTNTTFTDTGLTAGNAYSYRIFTHANNSTSWSTADGSVTFTDWTDNETAPPPVPIGFTLTDLGGNMINATWTASAGATDYLLLVDRDGYPSTTTGYEIASNTTAVSVNITGYSLETTPYYFSLWSHSTHGYSTTYATDSIGGVGMLFLGFIAFALVTSWFGASNKNWWGIQVFAGFVWIGVAIWWNDNPIFATASRTQEFFYIIFWGLGLLIGFMPLWYTWYRNGRKIPTWLGGQTEEQRIRRSRNMRTQQEAYQDRLNNVGRR